MVTKLIYSAIFFPGDYIIFEILCYIYLNCVFKSKKYLIEFFSIGCNYVTKLAMQNESHRMIQIVSQ